MFFQLLTCYLATNRPQVQRWRVCECAHVCVEGGTSRKYENSVCHCSQKEPCPKNKNVSNNVSWACFNSAWWNMEQFYSLVFLHNHHIWGLYIRFLFCFTFLSKFYGVFPAFGTEGKSLLVWQLACATLYCNITTNHWGRWWTSILKAWQNKENFEKLGV